MRKRTLHKTAAALTALALCAGVLTGCGGAASSTAASSTAGSAAASSEVSSEEADELAAQNVADLIDAIYVQEHTDDTDAQCAAAKAAWDALTDAQKELVEGEEADPDYFGRDTGDASKDDPRNADDIGENELLVVSFGTSFNASRAADIKGIEDALQAAYPDWSVRRAFTAQIIINHVQARDGEKIDNMQQAMDRAVANGVKNLVVQPTHLMHGAEYDEMMEMIDSYRDKFESVAVAEPLLGEVGADAAVINSDKEAVAKAITAAAVKDAGFDSLDAAAAEKTAFVFMGHGTSHTAKISYSQMQTTMQTLGYDNVFIGTVEGEPEETACENVIEAVKAAGYTKVVLRPLMVVAGDHANNDMAGADDDSWLSEFKASGAFEEVDTQIAGLGEISDIQQLYIAHTKAAIESLNG
ncbi:MULTISPECIES: sirohydrochlorin cobaltochelatase [Faecalibacterium]|uniref:sirohydrochlorin cobaltochelatase n=1 Tax=Faecalibacterium TaxID=216851 RepID=UPI000E49C521|nr:MULTISPECIES: sirohydrochlorin cobaltochelatase [Faecalibacterium]RHQ30116.1 cobalt chelatase [Faecalibacterium sp. AF28-13AC]